MPDTDEIRERIAKALGGYRFTYKTFPNGEVGWISGQAKRSALDAAHAVLAVLPELTEGKS